MVLPQFYSNDQSILFNNSDDTSCSLTQALNQEFLPNYTCLPSTCYKWNTNEEIASILLSCNTHAEWLTSELILRPRNGSLILYDRRSIRYRRDGYLWKKRKDGRTTREDHMKLKVQGLECIYACYVHSSVLPTFHRRSYWLLQNPDIVLVHYLNSPNSIDDESKCIIRYSMLRFLTENGDTRLSRLNLFIQLKSIFVEYVEKEKLLKIDDDNLLIDAILEQICALFVKSNDSTLNSTPDQNLMDTNEDVLSLSLSTPDCGLPASASGHCGVALCCGAQPRVNCHTHAESCHSRLASYIDDHSLDSDSMPSNENMLTQHHDDDEFLMALNNMHSDHLDLTVVDTNRNSYLNSNPINHVPQCLEIDDNLTMNAEKSSVYIEIEKDKFSTNSERCRSDKVQHQYLDNCLNQIDLPNSKFEITYFSPNWSYSNVESKVLILLKEFDRNFSDNYSIMFDNTLLLFEVLQSGAIRTCFPARPSGTVSFHIAVNGSFQPVSNSCHFEYRALSAVPTTSSAAAHTHPTHGTEARCKHTASLCSRLHEDPVSLRLLLTHAVRGIQLILASHSPSSPAVSAACPQISDRFFHQLNLDNCEDEMIECCQSLMRLSPLIQTSNHCVSSVSAFENLSLLHLSALLGYNKLICLLFHWRTLDPGNYLQSQVDPVSKDCHGNTPLSLACSQGYRETSRLLYQCNFLACSMKNDQDLSPLEVARARGHVELADELARLDSTRRCVFQLENRSSPAGRIASCSEPNFSSTSSCTSFKSSLDSGLDTLQNEMEGAANPKSKNYFKFSQVLQFVNHIISSTPDKIKKIDDDNNTDQFANISDNVSDISRSHPTKGMNRSCGQSNTSHSTSACPAPVTSVSDTPPTSLIEGSADDYTDEHQAFLVCSDLEQYFHSLSQIDLDFSALSLTDKEQRELYEAARIIQLAYRNHRGMKSLIEMERQRKAASVIQYNYRKYKNNCYYTEMHRAARIIQRSYRHYCEQKRNMRCHRAAVCIQKYFRLHRQHVLSAPHSSSQSTREGRGGTAASSAIKRTYSQRSRNLAAVKIQNFMRLSRNKMRDHREAGNEWPRNLTRISNRTKFSC